MQKPNTMFLVALFLKKLALSFSVLLHHKFSIPKRSNFHENQEACGPPRLAFQKFQFLARRSDLESQVLIVHAESGLLRRTNLFPYFMLVAFEAGSMMRAFILLLAHPLIALCSQDLALKVMVMISFFGLKRERFLEGSAVLPKCFLEDVGRESFEIVTRGKRKIAISDLPQVMVERFLVDYLAIDVVFGREMKVVCGYFVGLMEERRDFDVFQEMKITPNAIGVSCLRKCCFDSQWFSNCKEIYLVSETERRNWHELAKDSYPKPLIFHDGRLAFRPTFLATLAMFMWLPVGLTLAIFRLVVSLTLPPQIKFPILHLTGAQITVSNKPEREKKGEGALYVCNHRTLLDPLMISYCLNTPLAAVVYSLSRVSEILSPIKTVRLTRNRERDSELMHELLSEGDLVVCPEGTTCREPYLLRFSPLFSEIRDQVTPVAITCDVTMFYGTSARGLKCLDPLFFLMNPRPTYALHFLDAIRLGVDLDNDHRYNKANMVQDVIAKQLGFTSTSLTRKDKYLILAGNDGTLQNSTTKL